MDKRFEQTHHEKRCASVMLLGASQDGASDHETSTAHHESFL